MGLETRSEIEEIYKVQNSSGDRVAPATGEHGHEGADVTIGPNATETVKPAVPDRANRVAVHVEGSGAFEVKVRFPYTDGGSGGTSRSSGESSQYASSDGSDVFVTTTVASPFLEVDIIDTSGADNAVSYNVMVI